MKEKLPILSPTPILESEAPQSSLLPWESQWEPLDGAGEMLIGSQRLPYSKRDPDVLFPKLFNMYMKLLGEIVQNFGVCCHQYGEDIQPYLFLTSKSKAAVSALDQCPVSVMAASMALTVLTEQSLFAHHWDEARRDSRISSWERGLGAPVYSCALPSSTASFKTFFAA